MTELPQLKLRTFRCSGCSTPIALTDGASLVFPGGFMKRTVTIACWNCNKETTWRPKPQPTQSVVETPS